MEKALLAEKAWQQRRPVCDGRCWIFRPQGSKILHLLNEGVSAGLEEKVFLHQGRADRKSSYQPADVQGRANCQAEENLEEHLISQKVQVIRFFSNQTSIGTEIAALFLR